MALNRLFICAQNRLRSPTAEQAVADWPGIQTASAGVNHDADNPVSPELLAWAGILVMQAKHRRKLLTTLRPYLANKRIHCLDISDDYGFMGPELIKLLHQRVPGYWP